MTHKSFEPTTNYSIINWEVVLYLFSIFPRVEYATLIAVGALHGYFVRCIKDDTHTVRQSVNYIAKSIEFPTKVNTIKNHINMLIDAGLLKKMGKSYSTMVYKVIPIQDVTSSSKEEPLTEEDTTIYSVAVPEEIEKMENQEKKKTGRVVKDTTPSTNAKEKTKFCVICRKKYPFNLYTHCPDCKKRLV